MKKYFCKFLTQHGVVELIIEENQDLDKLAHWLRRKYGTFTTLISEEII